MSQFNIYIRMPDYLRQWVKHEYWNADTSRVEFPRGSAPRALLQSLLTRQPEGTLPHLPSADELPIEVPSFKGINPKVFCHLPDSGKKALVSCLKKYFDSVMWHVLHPTLSHDVQITDVIYAFLDRFGIDRTPQNWETVRQKYYRMRKKTSSVESF